jgi:hypothetical protein
MGADLILRDHDEDQRITAQLVRDRREPRREIGQCHRHDITGVEPAAFPRDRVVVEPDHQALHPLRVARGLRRSISGRGEQSRQRTDGEAKTEAERDRHFRTRPIRGTDRGKL